MFLLRTVTTGKRAIDAMPRKICLWKTLMTVGTKREGIGWQWIRRLGKLMSVGCVCACALPFAECSWTCIKIYLLQIPFLIGWDEKRPAFFISRGGAHHIFKPVFFKSVMLFGCGIWLSGRVLMKTAGATKQKTKPFVVDEGDDKTVDGSKDSACVDWEVTSPLK